MLARRECANEAKRSSHVKGVVKYARGEGNVEVRDVPEPKAGHGQVVIQVEATGVCGTDIHIYHDEYPYTPPVVLGHETAGVIVEVGEDVSRVRLGDRVTSETFFHYCGLCGYCRSGYPNLCPDRRSFGSHVNGGMTKYLVVPERLVHVLPENVETLAAVITEPLACCVHGIVERGGVLPGDVVLISGPGAIGQFSHQVAKAAGGRTILSGIDGDEFRLALGKTLGADYVVNARKDNLKELVMDLTNGRGADVVVEAAGANASLSTCLDLVRKGGTLCQMGLYSRPVAFDMNLVPLKEVRLTGSFASVPSAWPRALQLLATGQVNSRKMLTKVYPLTEWQTAFDAFNARTECKIGVAPVD
jgi:L-iditol 2-dehydrogenase